MRPFWKVLTTAVVAFVADLSVIDSLTPNPDEVDRIFDHPFSAIYTGQMEQGVKLAEAGDWWPFPDEYHVCPL